jgi:hypothetical protein
MIPPTITAAMALTRAVDLQRQAENARIGRRARRATHSAPSPRLHLRRRHALRRAQTAQA